MAVVTVAGFNRVAVPLEPLALAVLVAESAKQYFDTIFCSAGGPKRLPVQFVRPPLFGIFPP